MPLGRFTKAVTERKRYQIDYTNWLDTGEGVNTVSFSVQNNSVIPATPLVIDGVQVLPTGLGVQFYASGGVDGITYSVLVTMVSTLSQTKLDTVLFFIKEP